MRRSKKLYSEYSRLINEMNGDELVSFQEYIDVNGRLVVRVKSRLTGRYKDVDLEGDATAVLAAILAARKLIRDDDARELRRGPVPKPTSTKPRQPEPPRCPKCGGDGFVTHEDGYQDVCECRL